MGNQSIPDEAEALVDFDTTEAIQLRKILGAEQMPVSKDVKKLANPPKIHTTEQQQVKLNNRYKMVAMLATNTAYGMECKIIQEKDYKDLNLHYIIHKENDRKLTGCDFMAFIFINGDKNVKRRIEKLMGKKFVWFIFDYERYKSGVALENVYF